MTRYRIKLWDVSLYRHQKTPHRYFRLAGKTVRPLLLERCRRKVYCGISDLEKVAAILSPVQTSYYRAARFRGWRSVRTEI